MPPPAGVKRKRGDRQYSGDNGSRPSPHRPGDLEMSRHAQSHSPNMRDGYDYRGRGGRRGSRGGRYGGHNTPANDVPAKEPTRVTAAVSSPVQVEATPVPPLAPSLPEPEQSTIDEAISFSVNVFDYTHLTDEIRHNWDDQGKQLLIHALRSVNETGDHIALMDIFQEVIHAVCVTDLPAASVGEVVGDILASDQPENVGSMSAQEALLQSLSIAFEENPTLPGRPLINFMTRVGISEDDLRLELEQPLLDRLGLIRSTFTRMYIRKQTNILYRQANFNLMREESEGFAKLITDLFSTSTNEPPTNEVVHDTVERIKAMIGAFDLDVGRSLDVVLDVFGSVLVRHFRFLVKLLRASPWWPRTERQRGLDVAEWCGLPRWALPDASDGPQSESEKLEAEASLSQRDTMFWLHAREVGLQAFQQIGCVPASEGVSTLAKANSEADFRNAWIAVTGTLPPCGNRDAAQLLGFKLRFYSSSTAREPSDTLPDNLIHLSALLIKIGFISLNDLYPHIWRPDEEMDNLKHIKQKEKIERERSARPGAGARNALLMAGALTDDTLPVPSIRVRESGTRSGTPAREQEGEKTAARDSLVEPADQKVMLLRSLLAIGALPEAFFILGRFPWISDLSPELPEYIHRILHHCTSFVYAQTRPLQSRVSLQQQRPTYETDIPGLSQGQVRMSETAPRRTLKWANLDRDDSADGTDYRFYWDDWSDNIPVCRTVDDIFTLCETILPLVGVKIGQDPTLVLKLARIGKYSLSIDNSDVNKARWLDLTRRILLPSLSLTKGNAGVINEVFELMSLYSTSTRYLMYLEWSTGRTSRNPDIKAAFDQARAETKDILKRISKTNVKPMARSLARIAYANPHIVITTALTQIEVYDSIAEVFVEGARYFTDLGYDVLTWALISSMGKAGRSRNQEDGIFVSRWLTALSQFAGKIYKRYSMMRPGPVLQFVAAQLDRGNSTDLKMLEQIILGMAGISTDTNLNEAQLQAMGGGPLLQAQTILQLLDHRTDSKNTSRRLMKALQDNNLTAKFLVSMAQLRHACVFDEIDVPLKAIGNTFDEISRVMSQYMDLLRSNLSPEDLAAVLPDTAELLLDYGIPADIAFWITRPILARQIADANKAIQDEAKAHSLNSAAADLDIGNQNDSEEDGEASDVEGVQETEASFPAADTTSDVEKVVSEQWHPTLKPVMDALQSQLPHAVTKTMGTGFYVTFWQLSLYDISVPSKSYEDEMSRQKKRIAAITSDRSNVSASSARARESSVKQHQQVIDDLLAENKQHLKSYNDSRARLQREKDYWFADWKRHPSELNMALMEYCFLPRIMSTAQDAFFCFRFIKFLHSNATPNFRTLALYDSLLKPERLRSLIFMCTSKESDNFGRFLYELLKDLARWHKDKSVYEREAFGMRRQLPGFVVRQELGKSPQVLDFENFKTILFKWHSNIFKALEGCLSSPEYMHVRNAISVLRAVAPVYPAVSFHGSQLYQKAHDLSTSDRDDVKVAAGSLLGALSKRQKEWIRPQLFRLGKDKPEPDEDTTPPKAERGPEKPPEARHVESEAADAGRKDNQSVPSKADPQQLPTRNPPIQTQSNDSNKPPSRPAATTNVSAPRPIDDASQAERRSTRSSEFSRSHVLPQKPSGGARQPVTNPAGRSEGEARNGYRGESRPQPRNATADHMQSDNRVSHVRPTPHDRPEDPFHEQPGRYPRSHERSAPPDREDRHLRRDFDGRHAPDDRRTHDSSLRPERDQRLGRDRARGSDRDTRSDRDSGRLQPEPERKRPDLIDERRETLATSSRISSSQPSAGAINPERAALISNSDMSIRGSASEKPRGSRPSSPRPEDDRRLTTRGERETRPDRRQDAPNRPAVPPTQPHARPGPPGGYNRENRFPQGPIDMQHGRLEPESPPRPLPHITRTERQPEIEAPSGPRSGPRAQPRTLPPPTTVATSTADRNASTGSAPRSGRLGQSNEGPPTPRTPDAPGVHPSRMNQIASGEQSREPPRPSPINTQTSPPSGPRNIQSPGPPLSGPSPLLRNMPAGPPDGPGRSRNRHPIDALNNTLAQAQGPAGRGRGVRQNNGYPPQQMAPPNSGLRTSFNQPDDSDPNHVPVQPRPPSRRDSAREPRGDIEAPSIRARLERDDRQGPEQSRFPKHDTAMPGPRQTRSGPRDDVSSRKHPREDHTQYGGGYRGGARNVSENKRPRRGG